MVLPGEIVAIPAKRKNNQPPARAGRFGDVQAREAAASEASLLGLTQTNLNPTARQPTEPPPELNQPIFDVVMRADGNDPAVSSDDEPANLPVNRAEYYRSPTYQERTLREEAQWRAIFPKLFVAFMPCSRQTYQWCDVAMWNQDFNVLCRCKDWQKRKVDVDTVDLLGRMKLRVEVCDCTSDVVRLVRLGYMGSTPTQPRTAFSIRLLRFHHTLWKYSSIRIASFTETMDEYLDPQNPLFVIQKSDEVLLILMNNSSSYC
ncbi:hypothetical protein DFH28DRAFT_893478 [Melampsora americana]|nr:hypothetical protein DFH28DRAFT_893478 [Melampsora americana]